MKKTLMIMTILTLLFSGNVYGEEEESLSADSQTTTVPEKTPELPLNQTDLPAPTELSEQKEQRSEIQLNNNVENESLLIEKETKATSPVVNFTDSLFKAAILTALKLPADSEITEEDMAKLTILTLSNADISNISGLEYAVNLTTFNMLTNKVTDLSPLENLSKLDYVSMQGKNVTSQNFPNFNYPSNIIRLDLARSGVDDAVYDKIVKMTNLVSLSFDYNSNITTIAPLKDLQKLTSLHIQLCSVADFTVLNTFPVLSNIAAYGQSVGVNDATTTIKSTALSYDAANQSVHIPFSIMPNRLTNFDGYLPPFTTSTSANNTVLTFNDEQVAGDRLQIDEYGVTVLNVTEEAFENIATISYNARFDNPEGSYVKKDGYQFYSISAGTYLHNFNIDHSPIQLFHIQYNGNGNTAGEVPVDQTEYLEADTATVLEIGNVTKENATFAGWNTQADGKGTSYQAGETIKMQGDIVLYAQWTDVPKEDEDQDGKEEETDGNGKEGSEIEQHANAQPILDRTKNTATAKKEVTVPERLPKTGEQNTFSMLLISLGISLSSIGFILLYRKKIIK